MPAKKKPTKTAPKVPLKPKDTDWKAVALELREAVDFALANLTTKGCSGILYNIKTGKSRHWKEWFADTYELIPGRKIDREAMYAMDLPKKERLKFFKERAKKASAPQSDADQS